MDVVILGAGLSGLSTSYHAGHGRCVVLEKTARPVGHAGSTHSDGFTWDNGPHVSFTKDEFVRELFAESVGGEFEEFQVQVGNYHAGHWIDHPAQSHLYQVPEPLRSDCLAAFLEERRKEPAVAPAAHYREWLDRSLGGVFAGTFPAAYTRKYWTVEAESLTTDWVGARVFAPTREEVLAGTKGPPDKPAHYITRVRYPRHGGYGSFARRLTEGANVRCGKEVGEVDLVDRKVRCLDGETFRYGKLVSTIPLPSLVKLCKQRTAEVVEAADDLLCTRLLLVNVRVPHEALVPYHWLYVYDETMHSTRIHFTERLSPHNVPGGWGGIQVEVYSSRFRPQAASDDEIARAVVGELVTMGLVDPARIDEERPLAWETRRVAWANVVFDHRRRAALSTILEWLARFGLEREADDLDPTTDWAAADRALRGPLGSVALAGRFGQWKYYWTDDCVLRGRRLGEAAGRSA